MLGGRIRLPQRGDVSDVCRRAGEPDCAGGVGRPVRIRTAAGVYRRGLSCDCARAVRVGGSVKRDVQRALRCLRPDVILNCSAYNAVDAAEHNPTAAYAVNALGPSHLAPAAEDIGAILVHFSTDFVFDGTALEPYSESASPNPLSAYGASKLAGELEARRASRHFILRLESLFGGTPANTHRSTIDRKCFARAG